MKATQLCYSIIKQYEGLRLEAYLCPNGKWTIGYGHTKGVKAGDKWSIAQAEAALKEDVAIVEAQLNGYRWLRLNQSQFDALVSFVFNVGVGNFESSTLFKKLKVNVNDPSIPYELERWNKGDGSHDGIDNDNDGLIDEAGEKKVLPGLMTRRQREAKLYAIE
jgi:lysozyme